MLCARPLWPLRVRLQQEASWDRWHAVPLRAAQLVHSLTYDFGFLMFPECSPPAELVREEDIHISRRPFAMTDSSPVPDSILSMQLLKQHGHHIAGKEGSPQSRDHGPTISLSDLASTLGLNTATVRRLEIRPSRRGSRRGEARFDLHEVATEIIRRNPGCGFGPGDGLRLLESDLLNPSQTSAYLAQLSPHIRHVSVQVLAHWRLTGAGPRFLRITAKAVRYRPVDLEEWGMGQPSE